MSLADAKANAYVEISEALDGYARSLTGSVPRAERDSWETKALAAAAYLADEATAGQTAMLQAEADVTGETIAEVAALINVRGSAFAAAAMTIAGLRRKHQIAVYDATDEAGVTAAMDAFAADLAAL